MNGVIVIDKPKGWTSHDVVAVVRKMLKGRKAGHGGTLDPLATGVLPIYLGEGTKLVPFNLEGTKAYLAKMKLGQETDTLDAEGKVMTEKPNVFFNRGEIAKVLEQFHGPIRQTPPLFSAVKHEGLPLYKRARAGEKPAVASRETMIHELLLKEVALPFVSLEVTCARGTYIRALCADIGRVLGCGAHLVELRRLRSGKFSIERALTLEDLARLVESNRIGEYLISLKDGVDIAGTIRVEEGAIPGIRQGRPFCPSHLPAGEGGFPKKGQRVCLLDGRDRLVAIAEAREHGKLGLAKNSGVLHVLRVFHG